MTSSPTAAGPPHDQLPTDECIETAAAMLAAMSYPLRMRIVLHLLQCETTGGQLSRKLGVNRALLAHHLRHLRVAGVIERRRAGNHVIYCTAPPAVDLIRATIACADVQARSRGSGSGQGMGQRR